MTFAQDCGSELFYTCDLLYTENRLLSKTFILCKIYRHASVICHRFLT